VKFAPLSLPVHLFFVFFREESLEEHHLKQDKKEGYHTLRLSIKQGYNREI